MSLVSAARPPIPDAALLGAVGPQRGPASRGAVGVRHVEHVMGTSFTFDVRDPRFHSASLDGAVAWLHWVDRTFNPELPDSAVALIGRGELEVDDCPSEVAEVIDLCVAVEAETDGYFSPLHGDRLDPSGMVKGWAVERASEMLVQAGSTSHCINGGGDIRVVGEAAPGEPWRIGVADPRRAGEVVTTITGRDLAVATSGTSGDSLHINDPYTGAPTRSRVASVTVVGPDLTRADAYATAACAMGDGAYAWLASLADYTAVVVGADASVWTTPGSAG